MAHSQTIGGDTAKLLGGYTAFLSARLTNRQRGRLPSTPQHAFEFCKVKIKIHRNQAPSALENLFLLLKFGPPSMLKC